MGTIFIENKNLDSHDLGWSTELLIFILYNVYCQWHDMQFNGRRERCRESMDVNDIVYFLLACCS
jgi:hypothetical protein